MKKDPANKVLVPGANKAKTVKVLIFAGIEIAGYGRGGDVVDMLEPLATQYEREGIVTILEKENKDGSL